MEARFLWPETNTKNPGTANINSRKKSMASLYWNRQQCAVPLGEFILRIGFLMLLNLSMRSYLQIGTVFILAVAIHGCGGGGFSTDSSQDGDNAGAGVTTTTKFPGSSTTIAPGTTVPAPSTTVPPPPGGNICCSQLGGCFSSPLQIINYANATGNTNTCITVNGVSIRGGFGPCISCVDPTSTTTTTIPITTTSQFSPTTTTVPSTSTTGWPTTTSPGAG